MLDLAKFGHKFNVSLLNCSSMVYDQMTGKFSNIQGVNIYQRDVRANENFSSLIACQVIILLSMCGICFKLLLQIEL